MSYLEDFLTQINNRDFSKFLLLWEEYCTSDFVETEEFVQLLQAIKGSDFAKLFGKFIDTALPLWKTIQKPEESYEVLKHLIDLQTTNAPILADVALEAIKQRYGSQPEFNDRLRLIGLRSRENFQGALSNYDLLAHMAKGKFVFHTGGWGTGEITEISTVREQLAVEFENVAGKKHITFANAFKTLLPLKDDNFRARRFADADRLEKDSKEDPIAVIKILLRDLGPKTAAEIKDEMCELVIPEAEWTKWWQTARSKAKKDTMLETPETLKGLFKLRKTEFSHEQRLDHAIRGKTDSDEIIQTTYNFVRDLPAVLKKDDVKTSLRDKLLVLLKDPALTTAQELQVLILLDTFFSYEVEKRNLKDFINNLDNVEETLNSIEIVALKKRGLSLVREQRKDWVPLFLSMLFSVQQGTLRDYILKELNQGESQKKLIRELEELLKHPAKNPDLFVWYFQKILAKGSEDLPISDKKGQCLFFESFFILYALIETKSEYRDLIKKMYSMLSGKRFAIVRSILEGSSVEFTKEFVLLIAKCQTLSDHDIKILRSLAEVAHPSLATAKKGKAADVDIIWTTEAGYLKTQERARQIGTVEIVDNAREIEAARALGDLRENSEYKFALERRSRLQGELKLLSEQLKRARLITRDDISSIEVGIGNVVEIKDAKNKKISYTILGPWEADPDANILSFQSKLAQVMTGLKVGDTFQFRDEEFTVTGVHSYLEKSKSLVK